MKTIIAGGRTVTDDALITAAVDACPWSISEIVSGAAKGVDQLGEDWAEQNEIPVKRFPANWKEHGRAAGPIRNREMAEYAEALIAIWDGQSKGTGNMIKTAEKLGLEVSVYRIES